ncbi:MAG TPA: 50S ribosomal protein L14 [Candidatus Peregrinibacteria bacterium]|nr:50S ribosomal protein L14 [Candidatus Peregrinibacteria bacterium]
MIQAETKLRVADNTGAKIIQCIKVLGGSKRRYAGMGDVIVCSVKSASPRGTVRRRSVERALIVRTKRTLKRKSGIHLRFDENAAVIIDKEGQPKGTRIFGPVGRELKEKGFQKVVSQAPEVL